RTPCPPATLLRNTTVRKCPLRNITRQPRSAEARGVPQPGGEHGREGDDGGAWEGEGMSEAGQGPGPTAGRGGPGEQTRSMASAGPTAGRGELPARADQTTAE